MLVNTHSYYSLRYGTLSPEQLITCLQQYGYDTAVLTDINNSSGVLDFIKIAREKGFNGLAGMEFRNGDDILFIGIARNRKGFQELNELISNANLNGSKLPDNAPAFNHVFVVYPYGKKERQALREFEYIGITPKQVNKIIFDNHDKYIILSPVTFLNDRGYKLHKELRAINNNILYTQLQPQQYATTYETLVPQSDLLQSFERVPQIIRNTEKLFSECSFDFDFSEPKNKKIYGSSRSDDKYLLEKLAYEGMKYRYGLHNKEARARIDKELRIIDQLGFSAYFLITWDIVRYAKSRGFYHVGRGSGANSVVAYCLQITDVCPIELDLYFERFLNPNRKSPPDFDIDFSWDERDDVYDYIFKRYGYRHTALMGAMSTFRNRSIIRELGKVYGLPKAEIDRIIRNPTDSLNDHEVARMIMSIHNQVEDFPNLRTIHASGVLISEEPITAYTALDMPPKGFQTAQIDMYTAEDIGFEKFDILSQRGIGHIKEAADIVKRNRGIRIDVHDVDRFKNDKAIQAQLKTGDSIGCFYIESPAMRQLLKKLKCSDYLTLVAASSIIRPGVASSGMMKAYIERFHDPSKTVYLHPIMEEQLRETFGVMVYQEDVLKIGHHFFGLTLAEADVLRRMMSGKARGRKHLEEIERKAFNNIAEKGIPLEIAREVWRQVESFAGYSFSKAHSASFAVESFQSLFLKTYYPLEFMVAVINNWGGFYRSWVYIHEAKKAGGTIHLPCINHSECRTTLSETDVFIGFDHIKSIEATTKEVILNERNHNGRYLSLDNFIQRTGISLEQVVILIRLGAFRFTGIDKKALLWEAHALLNKAPKQTGQLLFTGNCKKYTMPQFSTSWIEDVYDEIELLGNPFTKSMFDLLRTDYKGDCTAMDMTGKVGQVVRILGNFVADKDVHTKRGEWMKFGTFLDIHGEFFDTVHFPPSLARYPLQGAGIYLIQGKVVSDFGFPSIEVEKSGKLSIVSDPRGK
ncbi:DNA polymerase III subunit alpha [Chitinophagaceae bacterium IBVUCB1]|nr:DNA polymerase III subunit alpha [Chitinophagaceae bacterium IBVUCB1]